ncbi:MAG: VOC family protein, partial [Nocardioidaceae bacterium]|nr:VOC family protein [Nocardioidaceae bacterium]
MDDNTFVPMVTYRDPRAALEWLERAFGFEISMAIEGPPEEPAAGHYEMSSAGSGRIVIGAEWADWTRSPANVDGANTQSVSVRLTEGIDDHCERARAAGAVIVEEPSDEFYGDRTYRALDNEGHCWTFAMQVREVTKAD